MVLFFSVCTAIPLCTALSCMYCISNMYCPVCSAPSCMFCTVPYVRQCPVCMALSCIYGSVLYVLHCPVLTAMSFMYWLPYMYCTVLLSGTVTDLSTWGIWWPDSSSAMCSTRKRFVISFGFLNYSSTLVNILNFE